MKAAAAVLACALAGCDDGPPGCDACSGGTLTFRLSAPVEGDYVLTVKQSEWERTVVCDAATREGRHGADVWNQDPFDCDAQQAVLSFGVCGYDEPTFTSRSEDFLVLLVVDADEGLRADLSFVTSRRTGTRESCGLVAGHQVAEVPVPR
jgi:hypothetical protein